MAFLLFRCIGQTEILPRLTEIGLYMNPPLHLPLCSDLPLRLILGLLHPEPVEPGPPRALRASPRTHWTDAGAPPPPPTGRGQVGAAEPSRGQRFSSHELVDEGSGGGALEAVLHGVLDLRISLEVGVVCLGGGVHLHYEALAGRHPHSAGRAPSSKL